MLETINLSVIIPHFGQNQTFECKIRPFSNLFTWKVRFRTKVQENQTIFEHRTTLNIFVMIRARMFAHTRAINARASTFTLRDRRYNSAIWAISARFWDFQDFNWILMTKHIFLFLMYLGIESVHLFLIFRPFFSSILSVNFYKYCHIIHFPPNNDAYSWQNYSLGTV